MSKIINSTYITLDGAVEDPQLWPSDQPRDPRFDELQTELALACKALVMGRRTYDSFAEAWPARAGDPLSDQLNGMPKYVVSTTLEGPEWNNTQVIDGDVAARIAQLKDDAGGDILQYGFGQVSRLMLEHGLLDEIRLWIHPLFVGDARPDAVLSRTAPPATFRLADATPLGDGVIVATYENVRATA